ncbi:PEP-CTERM sorting domain-containing protein [Thalassotalea euphylliae]|nr:PEP-CTERM sorting domain-containing protein [Thalassotalea euphylliae]
MEKIRKTLLLMGLLFTASSNANLMLSFDPAFQISSTGNSVSLTLMASGLGDQSPESLGAFDLDVLYDSSVLSYTDHTLSDGLGDIALGEALDSSLGDDGAGTLGLAVVSFLGAAFLDANQAGEFALAQISFDVDMLAIPDFTTVSLQGIAFSDADGIAITDVSLGNAIIATQARDVPEPTSLALLSLAVLGMLGRKRLISYKK